MVLRRRRRRRRSGDGLLTDAPADDEKPEWARVLGRRSAGGSAQCARGFVKTASTSMPTRATCGGCSASCPRTTCRGRLATSGPLGMALERGRLHFLAAFLDAGGVMLKEGGPPLAVGPSVDAFPEAWLSPRRHRCDSPQVGPKGRLASPRAVNRCRTLAGNWRRYEAAARRSLRPGSHATDLATYLATGIVGVREAAVAAPAPARRVDWVRRRAAPSPSAARPAVEGVALKSGGSTVVGGPRRLLLGDANRE